MQAKEKTLIMVPESDRELPPLDPERVAYIKALAFDYYQKIPPTPIIESELRQEQKREIFDDALFRGNEIVGQKLATGSLVIPVDPPLTHPNKSNKIHLEKVFEQKSRFQTNWELRPKSTKNRAQDKDNLRDFEAWASRNDRQINGVISNVLEGRISDPHLTLYILSEGMEEQKKFYTKFSATKARWENFVDTMGGTLNGRQNIELNYPTLASQLTSEEGGGDTIEKIFKQVEGKQIREKQPFFLTKYFFPNPEILKKIDRLGQSVEAAEQWENFLPQWSESSHHREIDRTIATISAELIGSNDPFCHQGWTTIRKPVVSIETVMSFANVLKGFRRKEKGLEFLAGTIYYLADPNQKTEPNLARQFTQAGLSPLAIELGTIYLNRLILQSLKRLSQEVKLLEIDDDPANIDPRRRADQLFKLDKVPTVQRTSVFPPVSVQIDKQTHKVARSFSIGDFAVLTDVQQHKAIQEILSVEKKGKTLKVLEFARSFGIVYDSTANMFKTAGIPDSPNRHADQSLARSFLKSLFDPAGRLGSETQEALWRITLQSTLPLAGKKSMEEKEIRFDPNNLRPTEKEVEDILSEMVHQNAKRNLPEAKMAASDLLVCATVYGISELLKITSKNGFPAKVISEPDVHNAAQEGWGKVRRVLENQHIVPGMIANLTGGGQTTTSRRIEMMIRDHMENCRSELFSKNNNGASVDLFPQDNLTQTFIQIISRSVYDK